MAQTGKMLPAMHKIQVQSLGWDDPLEKGMATHSSTLAWRIPWTRNIFTLFVSLPLNHLRSCFHTLGQINLQGTFIFSDKITFK